MKTQVVPEDSSDVNTPRILNTSLNEFVVDQAKVLDAIASMLAYCQLAYEKVRTLSFCPWDKPCSHRDQFVCQAKEIDDKQSSLAGFIVAYGGAADPDKVQPVSPAVYNAGTSTSCGQYAVVIYLLICSQRAC